MSAFQVTVAQLKAKSEELRNLNAQLRTQITHLSETEQTLNAQWEGEANTAFHAAFLRDKTQFDTFANTIEQYVSALDTVAAAYVKTESQNVEIAKTRSY